MSDDLEHHGVKGMKWGVRNEDKPTGRSSGKKEKPSGDKSATGSQLLSKHGSKIPLPLNAHEKQVLSALNLDASDSPALKAKYGPGTLANGGPTTAETSKRLALTPTQKKVLIAGGIASLLVASYVVSQKMGANTGPAFLPPKMPLTNFKPKDYTEQIFGKLSPQMHAFMTDHIAHSTRNMFDPSKLSSEAVHLPAGSILKRMSTVKETSINARGFYAAFEPDDVTRYKAALPIYWTKMWRLTTEQSGYVVNLKAKVPIKAPSEQETWSLFKSIYGDSPDFFKAAAAGWSNNDDPVTKRFFSLLKDHNYNAVLDFNDIGSLGAKPLRVIDGTIFNIDGHERLTTEAVALAQESVLRLKHMLLVLLGQKYVATHPLGDDTMADMSREMALAHFGVKGMRWGVRKAESGGSKQPKSAFGKSMQKQARSMTEEQIGKHKQALSGEGLLGVMAKLDKVVMGKTQFEGYHNKSISQLERSKERIDNGELIARTILWGPRYSK